MRVEQDGAHRARLRGGVPWTFGHYEVTALAPDEKVSVVRLDGKQGPEYWLARHNYYVITRYNRSLLYAMAVHQLGEAIRDAMGAPVQTAVRERR